MTKCFLLIIMLFSAQAVFAAESADVQQNSEKTGQTKEAASAKPSLTVDKPEFDYSCRYYSVKLPDGWKAYLPPTERQGLTTSIFGRENQNLTVTMVVTQHGGMDIKELSKIFADQYNASRPPVEKNGQYSFNITRNNLPAQVIVTTYGPDTMLTTITGNLRDGMNFIKNYVSSADYKELLPK